MGEEGGDGSVERREVGKECLFKAQSKEGAAGWERGSQCSLGFLSCCCCVLFFCKLFLFTLVVKRERENEFPLRWRRAKSRPHGSRRHAHARLHPGRSRRHGDLFQLR